MSIVIVAYNAGDMVRRCLESLAGDATPRTPHEVIVLDNASNPPMRDVLDGYLEGVELVTMPSNAGFGRACNAGAERSRGRYVLLLNPDAEVMPGTVDELVRTADAEPRCGVLGGRIETPSGELDPSSCWGEATLWSTFCFATGLSTVLRGHRVFDPESLGGWQRDDVRDVPVVTGCLFLMPRDLWMTTGGFDPDYFMYGEDADLCRRVRRAGRRVWVTPDAVALHAKGASSTEGNKTVLLLKGKVTYARKHFSPPVSVVARGLLVAGVALRAAAYGALGKRHVGWVAAWARRDEWRRGYPAAAA